MHVVAETNTVVGREAVVRTSMGDIRARLFPDECPKVSPRRAPTATSRAPAVLQTRASGEATVGCTGTSVCRVLYLLGVVSAPLVCFELSGVRCFYRALVVWQRCGVCFGLVVYIFFSRFCVFLWAVARTCSHMLLAGG